MAVNPSNNYFFSKVFTIVRRRTIVIFISLLMQIFHKFGHLEFFSGENAWFKMANGHFSNDS